MRTRACGILVHEGKVLLQRKVHETIWALPGGRVEDAETVEAALAHEFMEELGWDVQVGRRLCAFENTFEHDGSLIAQLEHCFQIVFDNPPEAIVPHDATLTFCWAACQELERLDVRPKAIKDALINTILPQHRHPGEGRDPASGSGVRGKLGPGFRRGDGNEGRSWIEIHFWNLVLDSARSVW
ncbi:NUDIX domain-containing protein [Aestuariivirga sp.]|uniref:NUDIX domain-containing protein n=1 Tax=Aestuariivirga sp. TaxID=2650926 RepID=UPI0025BB651E|nr:NUDIX domain-containing protein [Aestuariivirga sp.]MCA3554193.1 NUDIX domain-containing protein [Aestuariivirga sp.]